MGGRYGGAGWRPAAYGFPDADVRLSPQPAANSVFSDPYNKSSPPTITLERDSRGVFRMPETPPSGHGLPTLRGTPRSGRINLPAVVSSPHALRVMALRLAERALPWLRAADLIFQFGNLWRYAREPGYAVRVDLSGYTQYCQRDQAYSPEGEPAWEPRSTLYPHDGLCFGVGSCGEGFGSWAPGVPVTQCADSTGAVLEKGIVAQWATWHPTPGIPEYNPRVVNGVPDNRPQEGWQPDPRTFIQPTDPFLLPIGEPVPVQVPLPWRELPDREEFEDRAPDEQRRSGPKSAARPGFRPGTAPVIASRPKSEVKVRPSEFPLPDVSGRPRVRTEPDEVIPWPFETAVPGDEGITIKTDGNTQTTFREPLRFPRPHRGKEVKIKMGLSGHGPIRIAGKLTEFLDALEALWDAIPKRTCKPGEGPRSGPAREGGEDCGGNVSDCTGQKIKYHPPLHQVPRHRVRRDDGKWVSVPMRNAYGRPITHPRPQEMLSDLWNHYDKIDWCSAGSNLLTNELKDQLIGRSNRKATQELFKTGLFRRPVGPSTGPAI